MSAHTLLTKVTRVILKADAVYRFARGHTEKYWLTKVKGVVHVGANHGQERTVYAHHGLRVVWVEAIPGVFRQLETNIQGYPGQRAVQAVLTDKDGEPVTFHLASNAGASSSIFEFSEHSRVWPEVETVEKLELTSTTLATVMENEGI